jgi:hypothetical protein
MSYLGNAPALAYTSFVKQDFSVTATTSYSLDHPVANANELALFINFVRQEPTASYSASGTTLTLTEATSVGDDMYCVFLGKAVQTVNPPNASVGTSQLASSLDLSSKTVTLASNMKNTPSFFASSTGSPTLSSGVYTTFPASSEVFDTDNAFNNSTYKFTVPSGKAGKYFFGLHTRYDGLNTDTNYIQSNITTTSSGDHTVTFKPLGATLYHSMFLSAVFDLSVGEEVFARGYRSGGSSTVSFQSESYFYGYKLIG